MREKCSKKKENQPQKHTHRHSRAKNEKAGFSLSKQTLNSNNSKNTLANPVMEENPGEENRTTQNKYFLSGFGATWSKLFSSHPASALSLQNYP